MKIILLLASTATFLLAACENSAKTESNTAASPAGDNPVAAAPGAADWTTQVVETPEGGYRMGNPDAPVKLVEFGSMTCHVCRDFAADSAGALEDKYIKTGQVSFEFRNFVRDQYDIVASLLARCQGPGPFFKLTEQMFAEQDAFIAKAQAISAADVKALDALPTGQQFVRLAGVMGLDKFVGMRGVPSAKANACLADDAQLNRLVAMNQAASKEYEIRGTPTFLINGKAVTEAVQWKALEPKIQAALR